MENVSQGCNATFPTELGEVMNEQMMCVFLLKTTNQVKLQCVEVMNPPKTQQGEKLVEDFSFSCRHSSPLTILPSCGFFFFF